MTKFTIHRENEPREVFIEAGSFSVSDGFVCFYKKVNPSLDTVVYATPVEGITSVEAPGAVVTA